MWLTPSQDYRSVIVETNRRSRSPQARKARRILEPGEIRSEVGIPGALERSGVVKNANTQALIGRPLAQDLGAALGAEAIIENDANCLYRVQKPPTFRSVSGGGDRLFRRHPRHRRRRRDRHLGGASLAGANLKRRGMGA